MIHAESNANGGMTAHWSKGGLVIAIYRKDEHGGETMLTYTLTAPYVFAMSLNRDIMGQDDDDE